MEAFIDIGEGLKIWWKENEKLNKQRMNSDNNLYFFIVYQYCPHIVINNSKEPGILIEFADDIQKEVKTENLI